LLQSLRFTWQNRSVRSSKKNLTTDPDTQDMAVQMVTSQKTANSFIHFIRTSAS